MRKRVVILSLLIALIAVCALAWRYRGRIADVGRMLWYRYSLNYPPAPTTVPLSATAEPATGENIIPPADFVALPPGFAITVYADKLSSPRMMAVGPDGILYVAERGAGRIIRLPDGDGNGLANGVEVVASDFNAPSSLAFYSDGSLYVAETGRVIRLSEQNPSGVFQKRQTVIANLPPGGSHTTRTLLFSPDFSSLYISVGSTCNVCKENDPRNAAILRYNPDGSGETLYASGLRNAVGITFRPGTNELWASNNGRDVIGDELPPDTIHTIAEGADYGWPRCHSGRIVDPDFGRAGDCDDIPMSTVELQAHSAPLGLAFYTGEQFPDEYRGDLFVAFHGSWNRTTPTGFKVVRIPISDDGVPGAVLDFAAGWLRANGSRWGRPADVITGADGSLFVSDDGGGVIYRIFYVGQ